MKYLLFLLLVLGWTVAASAQYGIDVLVYDMKASNSGYGYVADTNTWTKIKDTNTAFLIVEEVTYNTANVRAVYTWKGKDKQKYAMDVNMGTVIMKSEELGSTEKQIGFLIDVNTNTASRLQLSGASKTVTIGRKKSRSCLNCHSSEEVETLDDLGREGCQNQ